jgi:hypothetical protein
MLRAGARSRRSFWPALASIVGAHAAVGAVHAEEIPNNDRRR